MAPVQGWGEAVLRAQNLRYPCHLGPIELERSCDLLSNNVWARSELCEGGGNSCSSEVMALAVHP